jgi:hypothetical protein
MSAETGSVGSFSLSEFSGLSQGSEPAPDLCQDLGVVQHLGVGVAVLVAHLERPDDGVAQGADADLERAAVPDQRRDVEGDRVVGGVDGQVGRFAASRA